MASSRAQASAAWTEVPPGHAQVAPKEEGSGSAVSEGTQLLNTEICIKGYLNPHPLSWILPASPEPGRESGA
ncbi:Laminin Subunit Alpha-1 [Manis pentadactyla]|nr:Laminin Subunit Alpha-1 [Manis pentadactyla]